jgi:hypothetical protein
MDVRFVTMRDGVDHHVDTRVVAITSAAKPSFLVVSECTPAGGFTGRHDTHLRISGTQQ